MPSKISRELINGGVCTVRHPLMLKPGELQQAANCILRPADTSVHRSPGRASYGTAASTNYSYVPDESAAVHEILRREIGERQAHPPGPIPPIHVRRGAAAYISGEETSLIESIEVKRG